MKETAIHVCEKLKSAGKTWPRVESSVIIIQAEVEFFCAFQLLSF